MANVLDYIAWRGDLSFEVAPINEVDIFLFTQIAMADLEGIVQKDEKDMPLSEVADRYFATHDLSASNLGALQSSMALPAFQAMGKAKRYKDIMMSGHINYVCHDEEEQFSATAYRLSQEVYALVYRGTDDYIIGWKEDCHLAIDDVVPAQVDALQYLNAAASLCTGKLIIAGHSKGGNLAVYAASNAPKEVQDRIVHVFNYDGPGFPKEFIEDNSGYAAVKNRITTIVSQNSIVGMLMETPGRRTYVRSTVDGLFAHDGFTWEIEVNHFARVKGLSKFSKVFNEVFTNTMNKLTKEEKRKFVDELFDILFETGADTLSEFKQLGIVGSVGTLNRMTKSKVIRDFFNTFMVTAVNKANYVDMN